MRSNSCMPPSTVLRPVLAYAFIGLGAGFKNSSWNCFISGLDDAWFLWRRRTLVAAVGQLLFNNGWQWFIRY